MLLHDAARPLVDQRIIADCVAALEEHDAAGVAVPASDTMVVTGNGVMHSMPRRETLHRCQTPQCFRLLGDQPGARAGRGRPRFSPTDDCGVVIRYLPDVPVHIVPGSERNIKVTYPHDLAVAEALLRIPGSAPHRLLDQGTAELPDQAAALAGVLEDLAERLGEQLHLGVADHQRRDQLDHFHVVA